MCFSLGIFLAPHCQFISPGIWQLKDRLDFFYLCHSITSRGKDNQNYVFPPATFVLLLSFANVEIKNVAIDFLSANTTPETSTVRSYIIASCPTSVINGYAIPPTSLGPIILLKGIFKENPDQDKDDMSFWFAFSLSAATILLFAVGNRLTNKMYQFRASGYNYGSGNHKSFHKDGIRQNDLKCLHDRGRANCEWTGYIGRHIKQYVWAAVLVFAITMNVKAVSDVIVFLAFRSENMIDVRDINFL